MGASQVRRTREASAVEEARRQAESRSYKTLLADEAMESNADVAARYESAAAYEDDFM